MSPSPSTCIACGRAFAENHELAAIPDASKIAFDPAHRRVWRVCASCSEWNLLGADAAVAALPELEARFAAAVPVGAVNGAFVPAHIGNRLELVRLGVPSTDANADLNGERLRGEVDRRTKRIRWAMVVVGTLLLLWCAFMLWISHGDPGVPILMLSLYSSVSLWTQIAEKVRGKRVSWRALLINAGLVAVACTLVIMKLGLEHLEYQLFGLLVALPLMLVTEPILRNRMPAVRIRLPSGETLRLTASQIRRVTLSWQPGADQIALTDLPKGRLLSGADAAIVFRRIYPWTFQAAASISRALMRANPLTESGYDLLRSVGGLRGLLRALEGFRHDNDGRILIGDLPRVYLVALDLAFADQENATKPVESLHDRAIRAAAVAAEAEILDQGDRT